MPNGVLERVQTRKVLYRLSSALPGPSAPALSPSSCRTHAFFPTRPPGYPLGAPPAEVSRAASCTSLAPAERKVSSERAGDQGERTDAHLQETLKELLERLLQRGLGRRGAWSGEWRCRHLVNESRSSSAGALAKGRRSRERGVVSSLPSFPPPPPRLAQSGQWPSPPGA